MNIITQQQLADGNEFHGCGRCLGSGVRTIANGSDDYDEDFCDCPAGDELYERGFAKDREPEFAQESRAQFDISNLRIYPWMMDWFDI